MHQINCWNNFNLSKTFIDDITRLDSTGGFIMLGSKNFSSPVWKESGLYTTRLDGKPFYLYASPMEKKKKTNREREREREYRSK